MSVLALEYLFASVTARFAAEGIDTPNLFGWRVPGQHMTNKTRIAWVPGDPTQNAGNSLPPRNPGQVPRSLAVLDEFFTVYITGQDPTDPENEQKQYHITRVVHDQWYRAVYLASHGTFQVRTVQWLTDKVERRWGATLRVVSTIQAPVVDAAPDGSSGVIDAAQDALAHDTTLGAEIDVQLADVTEVMSIPPGELPPVLFEI